MKLKICVLLIFISLCSQVWAQGTNRNQLSSVPSSSRFEIFQSELAAKITFKIDKYTGQVYQLVQGSNGLSWQLIVAEKHSQNKTAEGKVNYQLFTSGLAVRMTYLLNVNTGATWQLAEDSDIGSFWNAME